MRSTNAPLHGLCNSLAESATTLIAIVLFACCVSSAGAQYPPGLQTPPRSPNDPALVHQPGYSLQQATTPSPLREDRATARSSGAGASNLSQTGVQQARWSSESSSAKVENPKARTPLELKPRTKEASSSVDKPTSTWAAALSMFFSLAIVISLFLFIVWLFRKSQPNTFQKLPTGVLQVLGSTVMAPRQQVYVVRFGNKMLLVSHQPGQTQTLGEITDADEVHRLAGLCESNQPTSVTHSFRDVLRHVASGRSDTESQPNARKRT
ncbi:MAG: flagellar biosynthetic protein FliO [Planctomycetota bacterium]|nr:flagellar biosynthetic protein FliO [Planctomycetota bacterium]